MVWRAALTSICRNPPLPTAAGRLSPVMLAVPCVYGHANTRTIAKDTHVPLAKLSRRCPCCVRVYIRVRSLTRLCFCVRKYLPRTVIARAKNIQRDDVRQSRRRFYYPVENGARLHVDRSSPRRVEGVIECANDDLDARHFARERETRERRKHSAR